MQRIQVYNNMGFVKNETYGRDARGVKVLENCTTNLLVGGEWAGEVSGCGEWAGEVSGFNGSLDFPKGSM